MKQADVLSSKQSPASRRAPNQIDRARLLREIARIRAFETCLLKLFAEGKLFGTTHTCIGQEACAVSLYAHIDPSRDAVFTNHRCHGHFLAYGGSMKKLMAEIMGKAGGVCEARGGSQHLCEGQFFSQGVQGGGMPMAAGYAYNLQRKQCGGIVVSHIGDGTLGEGVVYETLNLASLLSLPLLIVLEFNGVAQSTDTSQTIAGDVMDRIRGFGIAADRCRADDPVALADHLGEVIAHVRSGHPFVQVLDTFRLMAHSKGDDNRSKELLDRAWRADYFDRLLKDNDPDATSAWQAAEQEVHELATTLETADWAPLGKLSAYADPATPLFRDASELILPAGDEAAAQRINELLNAGLDSCLASDKDVIIIGEDLLDPYGGAFKVMKGLSTKYGPRVISSPISEAAIVGFGNGVALSGGKAVVEIMFGDFVALAADQIINQAAKMHFMYGGKVAVPTTIRLVSGGYRGYGPTHSQSLETVFCGVPGLKVVALSRRHDARALLRAAVLHDPNPVLFVENKLLYAMRPHAGAPDGFRFVPHPPASIGHYPILHFTTVKPDQASDVTVVTHGGLTDMTEEALEHLIVEEELDFDYFVLTQLSPLVSDEIVASVQRTGRLVTIEEGPASFGIGTEIVTQTALALNGAALRVARVGAQDVPIPNSRVQEREVLPSRERIIETILGLFQSTSQ